MKKNTHKEKNRGFIVLVGVMLSLILLTISLGVLEISLKEITFSSLGSYTSDASFAADVGVECALTHDKIIGSAFPLVDSDTDISCLGQTIDPSYTGDGTVATYTFNILNIGTSGQCAKVTVHKDNTTPPTETTITSKGYNIGDGSCDSTNPNRVERVFEAFVVSSAGSGSSVPSAQAGAGSGVLSLTINKPIGTAEDDVMVASIGFRPKSASINPPSGWILVNRIDNPDPFINSLATYYKVAGASEPVDYTWTLSTSSGSAGGILSFSSIDTSDPIDVQGGQNTSEGLVHDAPSVNTTAANAVVITAHAFASPATWTPPSGMTEAVDVSGGNESIEINYTVQAVAGPTGVKSATASADPDMGNAQVVVLNVDTGSPPPTTYTVTPSAGSNGSISPSNPQTVSSGSQVAFTITPSAGYDASMGGSCGGSPSSGSSEFSYTTNPITDDCIVSATFNLTSPGVDGTGGIITHAGGYTIHTFNSGGTFNPGPDVNSVDALVVGGGGSGGGSTAGGGGGGGVVAGASVSVSNQNYTITVGAGGAAAAEQTGGNNGQNSSFSSLTAIGGGGGGYTNPSTGGAGSNGGSGGGGAQYEGRTFAAGSGTSGQGNAGGTWGTDNFPGGGGGGAGSAGQAPTASQSGNGGAGTASSISGSSVFYAGGGGGGSSSLGGDGGIGGGGAGSAGSGVAGDPNTGGGGGGGWWYSGGSGGAGGSGIVIIRYPTPGGGGPSNNPPVADAGDDQSITLPTSSSPTSGTSATDSDGTIQSTTWGFINGPTTPSISNGSTLSPTFSNMTAAGTYTFELTATDDDSAQDTDFMQVIVSPAVMRTLTVIISGTGTGSVSSAPGGITCNPDCTEDYTDGTSVTLTPTATGSSTFGGWNSGDCSDGSVTMNANITCTATFNPPAVSTITFVAANSAAGNTIAIPAHQEGDLIIIFAYRDGNGSNQGNTPPTIVSGWTSIGVGSGGNQNSSIMGYRIVPPSTTITSGTWANATHLAVQIFRGVNTSAPIGGNGTTSGNNTTVIYPALTMQQSDGTSWVAGFAGHINTPNALESAPFGMTNQTNFASTAEVAGHNTNSGVSSWSNTNVSVGGSNGGWRARTVEIRSQ